MLCFLNSFGRLRILACYWFSHSSREEKGGAKSTRRLVLELLRVQKSSPNSS